MNNRMNGCMSSEWPRTGGHLSISFVADDSIGRISSQGWVRVGGITRQNLPTVLQITPAAVFSLYLYQARTCSEAQFASPGLRLGAGSLGLHPPLLEWICLRNDLYLWLWFCLEGQSCNWAPHTLNTLWSWSVSLCGPQFGSGQVAQGSALS